MTMIDLRDKERGAIIALAGKVFSPGTELWAYGSRVKGGNHEGSDLDLAVRAPQQQVGCTVSHRVLIFNTDSYVKVTLWQEIHQ